jgi:hypothetical protein
MNHDMHMCANARSRHARAHIHTDTCVRACVHASTLVSVSVRVCDTYLHVVCVCVCVCVCVVCVCARVCARARERGLATVADVRGHPIAVHRLVIIRDARLQALHSLVARHCPRAEHPTVPCIATEYYGLRRGTAAWENEARPSPTIHDANRAPKRAR